MFETTNQVKDSNSMLCGKVNKQPSPEHQWSNHPELSWFYRVGPIESNLSMKTVEVSGWILDRWEITMGISGS